MKIPYGLHYLDDKDLKSVTEALKGNLITQGPIVNQFEKKICKLLKVKYAVAVSSCSAGLHIALKSIKEKKDKNTILTTPITFVATANSILHNNYKPCFVDIDKNTLNLDLKELKDEILKNKNIKAIIPVHLGGYASNNKEIYDLCKKNKIFVIEDAAHSFGGKYDKKNYVGSCKYSDITIFSFHPVKTITTGEGGLITTNSKKIYQKLIKLRNHGLEKNFINWKNKKLAFTKKKPNTWYYEMQDLGFNYRITDFQCALGISQLKKLDKIVNTRRKIAKIYDKHFSGLKNVYLPQLNYRHLSSNHLYILNINFSKIKISRNEFMLKLKKMNILTQVHYIPIYLHPYFKKICKKLSKMKNSQKYYEQALSIPIFFNLKTKDQKKVITKIKSILKN